MSTLQKQSRESHAAEAGVEHLRKVSLFLDIANNEEALSKLAHATRMEKFSAGKEIVREGEAGTEMYILVEGTASVFKSTSEGEAYRVAILNGKDHAFFGEGSLLDADSRSATIRADTDAHCIVLDRESFERFGKENPQWAFPVLVRIARAVMSRLANMNRDLTLIYNALVSEIRGR
jgi:CRP/FNR family cyclic AMP-dependent transcriptional regulator